MEEIDEYRARYRSQKAEEKEILRVLYKKFEVELPDIKKRIESYLAKNDLSAIVEDAGIEYTPEINIGNGKIVLSIVHTNSGLCDIPDSKKARKRMHPPEEYGEIGKDIIRTLKPEFERIVKDYCFDQYNLEWNFGF